MGLDPGKTQYHWEHGGDSDEKENALLVYGVDLEGNGFITVGDGPLSDGSSIQILYV